MDASWLPRCRFYLRRFFETRPAASIGLLVSAALLICTIGIYVQQLLSVKASEQEWQSLNAHFRTASPVALPSIHPKQVLPAFENTRLVTAINSLAEESKLTVDEVSFALDDGTTQPYLRYHATLTVSSAYPTIRHFVEQLQTQQSEVSLDSIVCARDDITSVELGCDLSLSAFYRKDGRG